MRKYKPYKAFCIKAKSEKKNVIRYGLLNLK